MTAHKQTRVSTITIGHAVFVRYALCGQANYGVIHLGIGPARMSAPAPAANDGCFGGGGGGGAGGIGGLV